MRIKSNMKKLVIILLIVIMAVASVSCSQADRVNENISKQADLFNVTRRISVINMRSDKPIFELVGNFSISNNFHNELQITVELENGVYKRCNGSS